LKFLAELLDVQPQLHKERKKEGRGKSRRAEIFALALFALFAAIPSSVLTFAHFASLREIFFGAISDL
jgi:hypothetical protein